MACVGAAVLALSPILHHNTRPTIIPSSTLKSKSTRLLLRASSLETTKSTHALTDKQTDIKTQNLSEHKSLNRTSNEASSSSEVDLDYSSSLKDYFDQSTELIKSSAKDGGPPRWFSPLNTGSHRLKNSPLLLFLPGVVGVGLGLTLQHKRLGKIFEIWCLHIPIADRTSFTDLVKYVEETIRVENQHNPKRPIYLVGESFGGCLALAVAARNPDIDLQLILANPATSFDKTQIYLLMPLTEIMPEQLRTGFPYILSLVTGIPSLILGTASENGLSSQKIVEQLSQHTLTLSYYISVLSGMLSTEAVSWKLKLLQSASEYANSRVHAVKSQTLILTSGKDQLLPSQQEGERLRRLLSKCEIRSFSESNHLLFLERGFNLVTVIKATGMYRRGRSTDYVTDYFPPTDIEFRQVYDPHRWLEVALNPVVLSTMDNGQVIRGLDGIPLEGPVLFVSYHMMLGLELIPLVSRFWMERSILVRGVAHPMMFSRIKDGKLPDLSQFDTYRIMGAVPVSASNFYKLFSSKSHVLLYPGGMREALHKKGEEYKLFWPEQSEFVRMAARFGATIIPFGVVGEDDIGQLLLDYDDLMKIPYFRAGIEELTNEAIKLRTDIDGEVANQPVHLPIIAPKIPGRFYYYFGKPIETEGRKQELRSREKSHELYLEVKSEVERCISFLKEKREHDPYRSLGTRLFYQATHGFNCEVPTFDI